jgi:hypothetical protein
MGQDDLIEFCVGGIYGWAFYLDEEAVMLRCRHPPKRVKRADLEVAPVRVESKKKVARAKGWKYFLDEEGDVRRFKLRPKIVELEMTLSIKREKFRLYWIDNEGNVLSTSFEPPSPTAVPPRDQSEMMALSVRQPYANQIISGEKTEEFRSVQSHKRERVYVYATERIAEGFDGSDPQIASLPRNRIVGSVEIVDCGGEDGAYAWQLANPIRIDDARPVTGKPQPMFFTPWPES